MAPSVGEQSLMMRIPLVALLLFVTLVQSRSDDKPTVRAYFGLIDQGPAFFISCRNDTTAPLNSGLSRWRSGVRVDGGAVPEPPGGELGPGLTTEVGPGESRDGILGLAQRTVTYYPPVKFGARVRWWRLFPLTDGRHTIAVQCGSVWSDDLEFYWDSDRAR